MNVTIVNQIEEAIATLQTRGEVVTNDAVCALAQVGRNSVKKHLQLWRAQQRADRPPVDLPPVAVAPAPPAPRQAPVPYLLALRQQCTEDDEAWRDLEREVQQLGQDRAEHRADYRAGLQEAQRLAQRYRQAHQARANPTALLDPDFPRQVAQIRDALVALVGETDAQRVCADVGFMPWWLSDSRA